MTKTRKLTTSAVLIAMSAVLMMISKMLPMVWMQGGSVTIASMVPIIAISLIIDCKWGILSGVVFAIIQMMTGFAPPPTADLMNFVLVIFLDYIAAFGVPGTAGAFYKILGGRIWAVPVSGVISVALRYICHIVSGVLIWGVYAEEGQSVLAYSVIYNGGYMVPEIIITGTVLAVLAKFITKFMVRNKSK